MATGEAIEGSNHLMDFILEANTNPGIGESGRGGVYLHKKDLHFGQGDIKVSQ